MTELIIQLLTVPEHCSSCGSPLRPCACCAEQPTAPRTTSASVCRESELRSSPDNEKHTGVRVESPQFLEHVKTIFLFWSLKTVIITEILFGYLLLFFRFLDFFLFLLPFLLFFLVSFFPLSLPLYASPISDSSLFHLFLFSVF